MYRSKTLYAPSFILIGLTCLGSSCGSLCSLIAVAHERAPAWAAPNLERSIAILDSRTRETLALDQWIAELADFDAVFIGEQHTDETTHRLQLAIYEHLLTLKQGKVILALEMFDRDVQPALDQYLAGETDEAAFLAASRPWSNYREAYRPLVESAKKAGVPVVASNFPAPLLQRFGNGGAEEVAKLSVEERNVTPRNYFPNSSAYWKRVDNAVRGHLGMMPGASDEERLYSTQSLWDNAMGESCADALDSHPGHVVLHVNGSLHSESWEGVVEQFRKRSPHARVKTIAIVPVVNPATYRIREKPSADYLALVEARASNLNEGKRSVVVGKDLSYLLHIPDKGGKLPLLIWLCDDGLTAEEGMQLCRLRFGETTAIAVVEPPYKELQLDLAVGGRWYWPESFSEDAGTLVGGIEEIWAYLLRHFQIDPQRVCLAGEGAGATAAIVAGLHTDRMSARIVAIEPRSYAKLKETPLPLPEYRLPEENPERSLIVTADRSHKEAWAGELSAYADVGVPATFVETAKDQWQTDSQQLSLIADSLGVELEDTRPTGARRYLVLPESSTRSRHWGRLQARWLAEQLDAPVALAATPPAEAADAIISTDISPETFARPGVLPRCPGPFGGTTVLVLPADTPPDVEARWLSLEAEDPLAKESRFHRVRVAIGDGERSLPRLLKKLQSENRRNVLIVPTTFYASPSWLHSLQDSVRDLEGELTLNWLPGLGGRKGSLALELGD